MPSSNSSIPSDNHTALDKFLESARPFLRGELETVDPELPRLISVLRAAGAGECWHKHGSFLDHLIGVYRILKLWGAPDSVCLCGLFHSAYSNSYVNLAIFPPNSVGRDTVRNHVGAAAEDLIHLFCIVPRQPLIHDYLLFKYTDSELIEHLKLSEMYVNSVRGDPDRDIEELDCSWRVKLQSILPAEGITVKHIKTGEDVLVPRRIVAIFLLMTMADFSDQLFGFQDHLFDNSDGRLEFSGNKVLTALWPGNGKPGLWLNSNSRMGAIYKLIVREEEILKIEKFSHSIDRYDELELVIPPVFDECNCVLSAGDQIAAKDLYWEAVCETERLGLDKAEEMLLSSVEKNPFVGEGFIVLSQIYLGKGRFEEAKKAAERGVRLVLEWGSPWDKRMSWPGWIAWGRVLLMKAKEKSWPENPWGVLNLGLVK